jgi:hypothetical protein
MFNPCSMSSFLTCLPLGACLLGDQGHAQNAHWHRFIEFFRILGDLDAAALAAAAGVDLCFDHYRVLSQFLGDGLGFINGNATLPSGTATPFF